MTQLDNELSKIRRRLDTIERDRPRRRELRSGHPLSSAPRWGVVWNRPTGARITVKESDFQGKIVGVGSLTGSAKTAAEEGAATITLEIQADRRTAFDAVAGAGDAVLSLNKLDPLLKKRSIVPYYRDVNGKNIADVTFRPRLGFILIESLTATTMTGRECDLDGTKFVDDDGTTPLPAITIRAKLFGVTQLNQAVPKVVVGSIVPFEYDRTGLLACRYDFHAGAVGEGILWLKITSIHDTQDEVTGYASDPLGNVFGTSTSDLRTARTHVYGDLKRFLGAMAWALPELEIGDVVPYTTYTDGSTGVVTNHVVYSFHHFPIRVGYPNLVLSSTAAGQVDMLEGFTDGTRKITDTAGTSSQLDKCDIMPPPGTQGMLGIRNPFFAGTGDTGADNRRSIHAYIKHPAPEMGCILLDTIQPGPVRAQIQLEGGSASGLGKPITTTPTKAKFLGAHSSGLAIGDEFYLYIPYLTEQGVNSALAFGELEVMPNTMPVIGQGEIVWVIWMMGGFYDNAQQSFSRVGRWYFLSHDPQLWGGLPTLPGGDLNLCNEQA